MDEISKPPKVTQAEAPDRGSAIPPKQPGEAASRARLGGRLSGDRGEALPPQMTMAMTFLCHVLGAGPVPAAQVTTEAVRAGIGPRMLRRARECLGVHVRQQGGAWVWELVVGGVRPAVDAMLGLSLKPIGRMADFPVGATVQVASGRWVRIVERNPCLVTIEEPAQGRREVAPAMEVFARRLADVLVLDRVAAREG